MQGCTQERVRCHEVQCIWRHMSIAKVFRDHKDRYVRGQHDGAHLLGLHWTRLEQEYAWEAKDWWWTLRGNVSAPGARHASFWTRAPLVAF